MAVDLDNTLWGGVIGEDGMNGIRLGAEYPGAAFQELQRALLDLSRRGILLAVCSKNNPADAMEALSGHPGMVLQPRDFAAMRINWNDKAQNLREIAAELNIGLDTIAFLDDNPVERQQVREQAPEAIVIHLPEDPMGYAQAVRDCPWFERLTLSEEDLRRGELLRGAARARRNWKRSVTSKEDFYRSLEQVAEIAPVNPQTLARVSQLTQKTNQFNLTTRRYTEQQIAEMAASPAWRVWTLRVKDRYADNGLVGVAIAELDGEVCEIDSFLMSCRVIGRTVETAFLAHLAADARQQGATVLQGWFLPTKKNAPAREFYRDHGFEAAERTEEGVLWRLDLHEKEIRTPEWISKHGRRNTATGSLDAFARIMSPPLPPHPADEIGRALLLPPVAGQHQYRARPRPAPAFDVRRLVAHEIGRRQVDVVRGGRRQHHAGFGFTAIRRNAGHVRAIVGGVNRIAARLAQKLLLHRRYCASVIRPRPMPL